MCWWWARRTRRPSRRWNCTGPARASRWCIAAPDIHNNVKYWIKPNIENRIKNGEITGYFNSRVIEIRETRSAISQRPKARVTLKNDFVFALTGYQPGSRVPGRARHPARSGDAAAAHQSGDAGERPPGYLSGRSDRGGHAHQRDFHRERPLPRRKDRRSHCARPVDIIVLMIHSRRDFAKLAHRCAPGGRCLPRRSIPRSTAS